MELFMSYRLRPGLFYLLLVVVAWAATIQMQVSAFDRSHAPGGAWYKTTKPLVALELASSARAFQQVIDQGDESHNIKVVQLNTYLDFVFIALYWSLFLVFASLEKPISKLVIVLISAAAIADLGENQRLLACLGELSRTKSISGLSPAAFGYTKWLLFAAALMALAPYTRRVGDQYSRGLAIALTLSGILTVTGLVFPTAMLAAGVGFLAVVVIAGIAHFPFPMTTVLQFIEYVYLLRFQITFAFLLAVALPALFWILPGISVGLYDARGFVSLTFVAWAAFQLAWTIMVTSRLVLVYGPERFTTAGSTNVRNVDARIVTLFALLAVPILTITCLATLDMRALEKAGAITVGLMAALIGLYLSAKMHFAIEDDSGHTANKIVPTFGSLRQYGGSDRSAAWSLVDSVLGKLPPYLQAGILRDKHLRSGHEMASLSVALLAVVYIILGFAYRPDIVRPEKQPAALFYLLFLLIALTWLLSGAAFFLDRLRLPVFTSVLLFSVLTGLGGTDHQFKVTRHAPLNPLPPDAVVNAWATHYREQSTADPKTAVIVATAGGGIRASAWTAEVLSGLQEDCGPEFGSSLLLVSSVSGGSVGSMFALAAFDPSNRSLPAKDTSLERVRFDAGRSSLASVGWGLLYPDLARTVPLLGAFFAPQDIDRGWALENAWMSGWKKPPNMSDWRADVGHGTRPAVIFNATAAESGQRFIVASTDVEPAEDDAVRFFREYPGLDLPVITAARLSASFPYVSPEGRASEGPEKLRYHVGDGGYYDNSGVLSALEWMGEAKTTLSKYRVIFILIDAAPGANKDAKSWSWQRQLIGPVETLLSVRSSSQTARDGFELKQALEVIGGRPPISFLYTTKESTCTPNPEKSPSAYLQPDESDPLSWHLNKVQTCYVEKAWAAADVAESRKSVCRALGVSEERVETIGSADHKQSVGHDSRLH
jgi:Patatin-like phospholipase